MTVDVNGCLLNVYSSPTVQMLEKDLCWFAPVRRPDAVCQQRVGVSAG